MVLNYKLLSDNYFLENCDAASFVPRLGTEMLQV